jgi:hypothetical protein
MEKLAVSDVVLQPATVAAPVSLLDPRNQVGTFYEQSPIAFPSDLFSFRDLEQIIGDIARDPKRDERAMVTCRKSATAPEDASQPTILDLDFNGRLESRLRQESLHIMITGIESYHARVAQLLSTFMEFVADRCDGRTYGAFRPMATIFLSSPHSIARLHNDPEHGWLNHLWGTKTFHIYPMNESALYAREVPQMQRPLISRDATRRFMEDFRKQEQVFRLKPGQSAHTPSLAPHWVETGPEINLSLTVTCFTAASLLRQKVVRFNEWAARKHLKARPYCGGKWPDRIKAGMFDVLEGIRRIRLV